MKLRFMLDITVRSVDRTNLKRFRASFRKSKIASFKVLMPNYSRGVKI